MSEIRRLTENDFDQSLELSQYAFQYTVEEDEKLKRKETLKRHEVWGEFEGETLTSKVHILPLTIFLGGKEMKMGGVAGVATWPEYRRNGNVSRLLEISLKSMKEKGQVISLLHPFDIDFYRRFGWELCMSNKKYEMDRAHLQFMEAVSGKVKRLTVKENVEVLNTIYEDFAIKYNGMLKRDSCWWENNVYSKGFHFAGYFNENDEAKGYILYKVSDKLMDIQEFIYLDGEARKGLWNFICQHDSMIDKVKILTPEDETLHFLLKNPKVKIEISPYFMARIVDVLGFLDQYPFRKTNDKVVLHIKDSRANWNNISIQIENGIVTEVSPEETGLTLDINCLTAILLSAHTATFFYEAEKLKGSVAAVLAWERLIENRSTSLLDFF